MLRLEAEHTRLPVPALVRRIREQLNADSGKVELDCFEVVSHVAFDQILSECECVPLDHRKLELHVMVAELTSSWTMAEYRMAIARIKGAEADSAQRKSLQLIIVVADNEQPPPSAQGFPTQTRPKKITDDPEGFIADSAGMLRGIAEQTGVERRAEPQRLFDAKEYRAAVISSMTLLEAKLRERLNKSPWPQTTRPLPMRSLVAMAVEQGVASPEQSI